MTPRIDRASILAEVPISDLNDRTPEEFRRDLACGSPFMDLRSVALIGLKGRQGWVFSQIWWSRGERLENLCSQLLQGLKLAATGY